MNIVVAEKFDQVATDDRIEAGVGEWQATNVNGSTMCGGVWPLVTDAALGIRSHVGCQIQTDGGAIAIDFHQLAKHLAAADGNLQHAVTVTDTAEAPQIILDGLGVSWTKTRPVHAINVLPGAIVVVNGSLAGGTLLISMNVIGSKKKSKDVLTIPSFAAIGQSSGLVYANAQLNMHIDLNEQVTAANVQAFLRGITFLTKGKGLKIPTRNLHITLSKADGLTGTATQVIQVHKKAVVG